jgi:hypothetical protein
MLWQQNSDPEILKLLEPLYQQVDLFPTTVQGAVTETPDILRTQVNKPVPVRPRLQMAFSSLWNFGRDVATFADSVLAIAEKFGITPDLFQ